MNISSGIDGESETPFYGLYIENILYDWASLGHCYIGGELEVISDRMETSAIIASRFIATKDIGDTLDNLIEISEGYEIENGGNLVFNPDNNFYEFSDDEGNLLNVIKIGKTKEKEPDIPKEDEKPKDEEEPEEEKKTDEPIFEDNTENGTATADDSKNNSNSESIESLSNSGSSKRSKKSSSKVSTSNNIDVTAEEQIKVVTKENITNIISQTTIQGNMASAAVTADMGTEIVNQAVNNGSKNMVIEPEFDGNVSKTEVSVPSSIMNELSDKTVADLIISTPMASVNIPNSSLSKLANWGDDIAITTERTENTVVLTLSADNEKIANLSGGITLTIPYENTNVGTVAVLVNADGSEKVIRRSVSDTDSMTIPLNGSATVKIINNEKTFTDTDGHWANEAINFVTARELYSGTDENVFSPDDSMTRAMLASVLYNLEDSPEHSYESVFYDVPNEHWAYDAVN